MTTLIEEYFDSKKKTYWKIWEVKDTDYPAGSIGWVLFFKEDIDQPMHHGVEDSVEHAEHEIKWAIATYLKSQKML